MTQPRHKIALVQHEQWPNVVFIDGLPFRFPIMVSGRDISEAESARILAAAEKLVKGYNLLDEVV